MYKYLGYFVEREYTVLWPDSRCMLAVSEDGRAAWVSDLAEPGDKVRLYLGAPMPFVIRNRSDGTYANLGHAYVHGIVEGEA